MAKQEKTEPGAGRGEPSFTPGPWTVEAEGRTFTNRLNGERQIRGQQPTDVGQPLRIVCTVHGPAGLVSDGRESRANARLIAAAPELYAIVRAYHDREDHTFAEKQANWEAARALLARIDGEEASRG